MSQRDLLQLINCTSLGRTFTSTHHVLSEPTLNSLDTLSDEEQMLKDAGVFLNVLLIAFAYHPTVQRFATDVVAPKVREMDENEQMDPAIIKGLFEQGVGPHKYPFDSNLINLLAHGH